MLLLRCYCCDGAVQQQLRRAYILRVAFERRDAQNERDDQDSFPPALI